MGVTLKFIWFGNNKWFIQPVDSKFTDGISGSVVLASGLSKSSGNRQRSMYTSEGISGTAGSISVFLGASDTSSAGRRIVYQLERVSLQGRFYIC